MSNFSQSKVKQFRRCQRQYSFRHDTAAILGKDPSLEMVPLKKKLPLYKGTWMHALQEGLHKQWAGLEEFEVTLGDGKAKLTIMATSWRDVQAELTNQFNNLFEEEREEIGDLPGDAERLFKAYLRFWRADQDRFEVATLPDGSPAIEFLIEVPLDEFGLEGHSFKGRIDLMVWDHEYEDYWIWDAKWMKTIPPPDERMMSPQNALYVWGAERTYGIPVRGFLYNYGRSKTPSIPHRNKNGYLSLAKKIDTDQHTFLAAIKDAHGDQYKRFLPYYKDKLLSLRGREGMWFDRQRIPVEPERQLRALKEYVSTVRDINRREKREGYIPRSYFYDCRRQCDYHGPCVAEYQGLSIEPIIKAEYQFTGERYGKEEDLLHA